MKTVIVICDFTTNLPIAVILYNESKGNMEEQAKKWINNHYNIPDGAYVAILKVLHEQ